MTLSDSAQGGIGRVPADMESLALPLDGELDVTSEGARRASSAHVDGDQRLRGGPLSRDP